MQEHSIELITYFIIKDDVNGFEAFSDLRNNRSKIKTSMAQNRVITITF